MESQHGTPGCRWVPRFIGASRPRPRALHTLKLWAEPYLGGSEGIIRQEAVDTRSQQLTACPEQPQQPTAVHSIRPYKRVGLQLKVRAWGPAETNKNTTPHQSGKSQNPCSLCPSEQSSQQARTPPRSPPAKACSALPIVGPHTRFGA